jgi:hypothetical protein
MDDSKPRCQAVAMHMSHEILTLLLRGGHLDTARRVALGLLPLEILRYAEVRRHLVRLILQAEWFPRPLEEHVAGEAVDEHIIVQRLAGHRFACHARRAAPLDPTALVEEAHPVFHSARRAADFYLRWELNLPGDLDGWEVRK